jgi:hypothetical protein
LTKTLAESLNQANDFLAVVKAFQKNLVKDLEVQIESSRSLFGQFISKLQLGIHGILETVKTGSEEASAKLKSLNKGLHHVDSRINSTDLLLQAIMQSLAQRTQDLETTHLSSLSLITTRTNELDQSLSFLIQSNIQTLSQFLEFHLEHLQNFTHAVQAGNEVMEKHINSNTQKLEQQAEKISKMGTGSSSFANWVMVTTAFWQVLRTWSPIGANQMIIVSLWVWTVGYLFPGILGLSFGNLLSAFEIRPIPILVEIGTSFWIGLSLAGLLCAGVTAAVILLLAVRRERMVMLHQVA